MRYIVAITYFLVSSAVCSFGQNATLDIAEPEEAIRRKPVTFTHQPILLLKITPTALLANDNVLQFGGEIAPPFGKFSFNFDYGIGKGAWSLNKYVKENLTDTETKLWRAEIRTYFSDWFPFYALDKKPFGRYYALELMNKTLTRTQPVGIGVGGKLLPNFVKFSGVPVELTEQAIHLKFGKHFLINRFIFVDAFVGIGPGRYNLTGVEEIDADANETVVFNRFKASQRDWKIGTKGLFFSRTAGVRLCLAL
jgi:hypothetical protein